MEVWFSGRFEAGALKARQHGYANTLLWFSSVQWKVQGSVQWKVQGGSRDVEAEVIALDGEMRWSFKQLLSFCAVCD